MASAKSFLTNFWGRLIVLGILACAAWAVPDWLGQAAAEAKSPRAEDVQESEKQYQAELAAVKEGRVAEKTAPGLVEQADKLAQKGKTSLAGGRLLQAADYYRQARWLLPYLAPGLPEKIGHVFGNARLRHANDVNGLAYSSDGGRLATASADGTVKIWDMGNGRELLTYRGHGDYVRTVAFSPDGKSVASAGGENDIHLWDAAKAQIVKTLKGPAKVMNQEKYVTSVAFSPDGALLASGWNDENVRIYDAKSGALKTTIKTDLNVMVEAVAYSPDGKYLGVANADGVAQLYGTERNNRALGIGAHTGSVYQIVFSSDNKVFATCGANGAKVFKMPDLGANPTQPVHFFPSEGKYSCKCVAFRSDNRGLAVGCSDKNVRLFDLDNNDVATFQGHADEIKAVAFSPSGGELASASADHTARLWQLETGQQSRDIVVFKGAVWSAAFSPDGLKIVAGGADKTVKIVEVSSGKTLHALTGHKSAITTVAFSGDGKKVLSCGGDKTIKLWDVDTGELIRTLEGHESTVTGAAFSHDGKQIVSGGADMLVKIWDANTGKVVHTLKDNKAIVAAVAFSPDGTRVASGNVDQTIALWDARSGKLTTSWRGHGAAVSAVAFSPNGDYLASCGADHLIKVWKLLNPGNAPIILDGHTNVVSSVAFSSDSRFLCSGGGDQLIKLWKLEGASGKEVRHFRGHKDWISSVELSTDGHYLVSASVDKTVKTWELTSREVALSLDHSGEVVALAASPDGKLLASGSADRTIEIWDLKTGALLHTLLGHEDPLTALFFTPDSKTLIASCSAENANTLKLWDAMAGKEIIQNDMQKAAFSLNGRVPAIGLGKEGKNVLLWLPGPDRPNSYSDVLVLDLLSGEEVRKKKAADGKRQPLDEGRNVNCLAFSADGALAALGAMDGGVRIYDVNTRERQAGGDWPVHQKALGDLVFTPDGKTLITGDQGGEIKIWTIEGRKLLHTIKEAHSQKIVAFAMSPNGKRLASTSSDNTVKVWDVGTAKEVRKWEYKYPSQDKNSFVRNLVFSADSKAVITGNADTTVHLLALAE